MVQLGAIAKPPISIQSTAPILDLMKLVVERNARHILVLDNGVITGIVTLSDVVAYLASSDSPDLSIPVSALASQRIYSARPETGCEAAARAMTKLGITSLMLTDGRIVAERDLLRACRVRMPRGVQVRSLSHRPAIIKPGSTIHDAAKAMHGVHRRHAVLSEDGSVSAVISARDLIRAIVGGASVKDPVDSYASWAPVTIGPDMDVVDALDLMITRDIWYLPIVDEGGLLGAVSDYDMLTLLALEK